MDIRTVTQDDEDYREVKSQLKGRGLKQFNYDALAEAYNQAEVRNILVFPYPPRSVTALKRAMSDRGLVPREDFTCKGRTDEDGTYVMVMQRLSEQEAQIKYQCLHFKKSGIEVRLTKQGEKAQSIGIDSGSCNKTSTVGVMNPGEDDEDKGDQACQGGGEAEELPKRKEQEIRENVITLHRKRNLGGEPYCVRADHALTAWLYYRLVKPDPEIADALWRHIRDLDSAAVEMPEGLADAVIEVETAHVIMYLQQHF